MGPHTSRRTSPTSHQPVRRRDALHVGLRLVAQQRELKKLQGRVKKNAASSKEQRPEKRKSHVIKTLDV